MACPNCLGFLAGESFQKTASFHGLGINVGQVAVVETFDDQRAVREAALLQTGHHLREVHHARARVISTSFGARKSFTLMPTTTPSTVAASSTGSSFPSE